MRVLHFKIKLLIRINLTTKTKIMNFLEKQVMELRNTSDFILLKQIIELCKKQGLSVKEVSNLYNLKKYATNN